LLVFILVRGSTTLVGLGLIVDQVSRSHAFTNTTIGRNPLDERSARSRDFYLTTHNTHKRQTSKLLVGFEPAIPTNERPHPHVLDLVAIGIGSLGVLHAAFTGS
jgi:hypothetical protein